MIDAELPRFAPPAERLLALRRGLLAGLAFMAVVGEPPAYLSGSLTAGSSGPADLRLHGADFGAHRPSPQARLLADGVIRERDHQGLAFFVVDKAHATLYAFDADARLLARSPVLLGAAPGDDSVPGIGTRPMAQILPIERTTPAGRFVAEIGHNLAGEDIVWVDHGAAISMHRVRTGKALERRAERLDTPTVDDNRISYGCINVPVDFYERHVKTAFAASRTAIVYVMPQTRSLQAQFAFLRAPDHAALPAARPADPPP